MSSRRRRRREQRAPMPATGAGLLRFFEEDTPGIRVPPEVVVILAVALIAICIIAQWAA
ncbi:preprotein translocase subunit Sec61beta [Candidatus Bathyarchaeota archaeon]|nr:MAG: preprotein translocase subunit Sec61beta [Candidatus Bathyarchaeota archaeon]RLI06158.1 MAG: preprotein translocase subunit Sec61beta [Candidatus Bathyarchaeota archaeon]